LKYSIVIVFICLTSCKLFKYSGTNKIVDVYIIEVTIGNPEADSIRKANIFDYIDTLSLVCKYNECISLPHCGLFNERYKKDKLETLIAPKKWFENIENKNDVETVVILKYRGMGSFSGLGDDIETHFIKNDEQIFIPQAFNKNEVLYDIQIDRSPKFGLQNISKLEHELIAKYQVNTGGKSLMEIYEIHNIKVHKAVKILLANADRYCI